MAPVMERAFASMMIVTRPNYDPVTRYLSAWSSLLIAEADERNIQVIDLAGLKANRRDLEGRIKKMSPSLIIINGHGSETAVTGQDEEVIVEAGTNSILLKGRITYAVSCDSAAVLGREVGAFSGSAYIGYEKAFAMMQSRAYVNRPLEDPFAEPFMKFSNHIVISLLKGHGAGESVRRAKEVGVARVHSLLASNSDVNSQAIARYLWWDVRHLVCHGDQEKTLSA